MKKASGVMVNARETDVNLLETIDLMILSHIDNLILVKELTKKVIKDFDDRVDRIYQKKRNRISESFSGVNIGDIKPFALSKPKLKLVARSRRLAAVNMYSGKFSRPEFVYLVKGSKIFILNDAELDRRYSDNDIRSNSLCELDSEYVDLYVSFIDVVNEIRAYYSSFIESLLLISEFRSGVYPSSKKMTISTSYEDEFMRGISNDHGYELKEANYLFNGVYKLVCHLIEDLVELYSETYIAKNNVITNKLKRDKTYKGLFINPIKFSYRVSRGSTKKIVSCRLRRYIKKGVKVPVWRTVFSRKIENSYRTYKYEEICHSDLRPVPDAFEVIVRDVVSDINFLNKILFSINDSASVLDKQRTLDVIWNHTTKA